MDIDSTNISELPILNDATIPSADEAINHQPLTTERNMMDNQILQDNMMENKRVRFDDDNKEEEYNKNDKTLQKQLNNDLSLQTKIVILATLLFYIFMDVKVRKYILNILVQIIGGFLQTEHGNFTSFGVLFYSLFFGLVLYTIVTTIDISSFHLAL